MDLNSMFRDLAGTARQGRIFSSTVSTEPLVPQPVANSNFVNNSVLRVDGNSFNVTNGTAFNATVSFNNENYTTKLCGFPAFCSNEAYRECANTPLRACNECSKTGAGFFVFFVDLLGLACVFGNVLVMVVLKKIGLRQSFNKTKFSLAVAGFLTGVQLLVVSVYNFSWTMNVSLMELDQGQLLLTGTPEANVGEIFFLLTFTSSLYHLVFMGAQCLYAIKWPMSYRLQRSCHVTFGLVVVWLLALTSSTVPAWFPDSMVYTYQHTILLFYVSNTYYSGQARNFNVLNTMMICFIVVPYIIMTFTTFVTLYSVRTNIKKLKQIKHGESANQKPVKVDNKKNQICITVAMTQLGFTITTVPLVVINALFYGKSLTEKAVKVGSKEIEMCVTVALMQLGFTITIIPLVVFNALFYGNFLTCDTASLPLMFCFYLSMSNSLLNILVYSFRNKAFAKTANEMLAIPICCPRKEDNIQASTESKNTTGMNLTHAFKKTGNSPLNSA